MKPLTETQRKLLVQRCIPDLYVHIQSIDARPEVVYYTRLPIGYCFHSQGLHIDSCYTRATAIRNLLTETYICECEECT